MLIKNLFKKIKDYTVKKDELYLENRLAIDMYCAQIFKLVSKIMVGIFSILVVLAPPFFNKSYFIVYLILLFFFLLWAFLFHHSAKNNGKNSIKLVYILVFCLYIFATFISVSALDKSHPATTFACLQVLFPILIFDRARRINFMVMLSYFIHSLISYFYKSQQSFIYDVVTIGAFTLVGMIVGEYERWIKLCDFEKDKILIKQRDTDALTGLNNRRMLFETFVDIREKAHKLSGLLMIDIDHFKWYNDTLGHQAGDKCLESLGKCFMEFGEEHNLEFFRYGGEEFTAISRSSSFEELQENAKKLREKVLSLKIPFPQNKTGFVTISIGCAPHYYSQDSDLTIKIADSALYEAKENGRNCVVARRELPPENYN